MVCGLLSASPQNFYRGILERNKMFDKLEERCKLGWKSVYAQLDWKRRTHRERRKRFIEAMSKKLFCQECRGSGELLEDVIYDHDLYGPCGWCDGIGYVTPWERGQWLRCKHEEKIESRGILRN